MLSAVEAVLLSLTGVQRVAGERAGADSPLGDIAGEFAEPEVVAPGVVAQPCEGLIHFQPAASLILPLACSMMMRLLRALFSWVLRIWASAAVWCWRMAMVATSARLGRRPRRPR